MQIIQAPGEWYDGITSKEMEFLKYYAENGRNGTQAVLSCEAYNCNENSANHQAVDILSRPRVKAARDRLLIQKFGVVKMTAERLIDELTQMSTFDPADLFNKKGRVLKNIHDMPEKARKALISMDVVTMKNDDDDENRVMYITKIRFDSKKAYQKMLGETMAMFTEKKIIEGGDKPIKMQVTGEDINDRINNLLGDDKPAFDPLEGLL